MSSRSESPRIQSEILTEPELKEAYIQLLYEGYQILGVDPTGEKPAKTMPELEALQAHEIEMVADRDLAKHYKVQGAYRVSGAVARVFYVTPKKRDHLLEMEGKLGVNEPYGIYTRRLNSRTVREPEHDDPKWNELTRIQYHPVDSETGQDLPRCFSFIRKIALYLHGATQNELTLKFTPQSMKNWIRTGELNFRESGVILTWSQLAPISLAASNIWHSSREAHLQLDVRKGGETQSFVFSSQIARLRNGSYVPWKKSDEEELFKLGRYTDYNYTGPYDPLVAKNPRVAQKQALGQPPLELVPPPFDGRSLLVNYNAPPPPPILGAPANFPAAHGASDNPYSHHENIVASASNAPSARLPLPLPPHEDPVTGRLIFPAAPPQHSFSPSIPPSLPRSPSFASIPPPPSQQWLQAPSRSGSPSKRPRHVAPQHYQSPYKSLSHRQQALYRQEKPLGDMAHRF